MSFMTSHHIVVGIDFSHCSANALKETVRLAGAKGAEVTAVHIIDEQSYAHLASKIQLTKAEVMKKGREELELWVVEQLGRPGPVKCEVLMGQPFLELVEACYRHDADLLVLGTRGLTGSDDRTGVVAAKCVRKAPIRVMLVRYHQEEPFSNIGAALDFSVTSKLVVREATAIARQFGSRLHLVNVIRPVGEKLGELIALSKVIPPGGEPPWREEAEAGFRDIRQECAEDLEGLEVETHVTESVSPSNGVIEFAKQHDIDLLVLASRGRTGLNVLLLGTTAEKVIGATPCSTLVIKPEGFKPPIGV